MNYNNLLNNYIDACPYDEPIFIEDIKTYFQKYIKDNFTKAFKTIYVYINRLVKENKIVQFMKGIYYKPTKGIFGNKVLSTYKVINKKYICDEKGIKGYHSGAYLFNKIGLTTQVPNETLIITNECPNKNEYKNEKLGVVIRKPKIKITNDNYHYLQLFDILNNPDDINIEVENPKQLIFKFIKENNLDIEKIFKYAHQTNNFKAIKKLYELGEN